MLKQVTLYGELAEKYGKDWSLDVSSPGEAIKALSANNPGFTQFVASSEQRGVGYKVMVGKSYLKSPSELSDPSGKQAIKIVPVVLGAKSNGLTMILIGAVLLGGAGLYYQMSMNASLAASGLGAIPMTFAQGMTLASGSMAAKLGGALLLGGISAMLAPTPAVASTATKAQNYAFNGAANTTRQGVAIPVCYGQLMVGGAVISSGVQPEDYTP